MLFWGLCQNVCQIESDLRFVRGKGGCEVIGNCVSRCEIEEGEEILMTDSNNACVCCIE